MIFGAIAALALALPGTTTATAAPAGLDADDAIIIIEDDSTPAGDASHTSTSSSIAIEDGTPKVGSTLLDVVKARASLRLDGRFSMDTSFDRKGEEIGELALGGRLELDVELSESWAFYSAPNFTYVTGMSREGNDREILYTTFPEAQLSFHKGPLLVRAGALIFSWGSSDFVSPTDVLNPFDLRRSVLGLGEFAKIPVLGAEGALHIGPLTLRGVIEPFFTASRFHIAGWDFAVLETATIPGADILADPDVLNPAFLDRLGDELIATQRPRDRIDNATLGARATLSVGDLDLSVSAIHGWDTLPRLIFNPDLALVAAAFAQAQATDTAPPFDDPDVVGALVRLQDAANEGRTLIEGRYLRRNLLGIDGTFAIDPFVLKFDMAYTFDRTFYTWAYEPTQVGWLMSVLGVEYFHGDDLQIIVEGFAITATHIDSNVRLLYLEANTPPPSQFTGQGTRSIAIPGAFALFRYSGLLDGDLTLELAVGGTFTRGDLVIFPQVGWHIDEHHQLGLGGAAVEGKKDSYGGLYTHTDQLYVTYRFTY